MPQWTPFTIDLALRYVLNQNPPPPPAALYVALFRGSARPGAGAELLDPSYHRQPVGPWQQDGAQLWRNATQVNFEVANDGDFDGVGVYDATVGGHCIFWHDYDLTYSFAGGTSIPVPAGGLLAGLTNPDDS